MSLKSGYDRLIVSGNSAPTIFSQSAVVAILKGKTVREATIIRRRSDDPFCRIPNKTLQDPALSFKAKGILAYLISKKDGWIPRVKDLINNSSDGESAITSGLVELREQNYAELQKCYKSGRIFEWRLVVADSRVFQSSGKSVTMKLDGEKLCLEKLDVENLDLENRPLSNTDAVTRRNINKNDTCATDEQFNQFWQAYPKRKAKADAEKAWLKVKPECVPLIMAAVEVNKRTNDWLKDGGKFIPYPASWLNARRWEDEVNVGTKPIIENGDKW
jgi:hypothetical protein